MVPAQRGYSNAPNNFPGVLYDLTRDLAERRNLYGEHPEVVKQLKALLEEYKRDGCSTPGPARQNRVAMSLPADGADGAPEQEDESVTTVRSRPGEGERRGR